MRPVISAVFLITKGNVDFFWLSDENTMLHVNSPVQELISFVISKVTWCLSAEIAIPSCKIKPPSDVDPCKDAFCASIV